MSVYERLKEIEKHRQFKGAEESTDPQREFQPSRGARLFAEADRISSILEPEMHPISSDGRPARVSVSYNPVRESATVRVQIEDRVSGLAGRRNSLPLRYELSIAVLAPGQWSISADRTDSLQIVSALLYAIAAQVRPGQIEAKVLETFEKFLLATDIFDGQH